MTGCEQDAFRMRELESLCRQARAGAFGPRLEAARPARRFVLNFHEAQHPIHVYYSALSIIPARPLIGLSCILVA